VEEVAGLLRVNRKTVYEAVRRGEIPGAIHLGKAIRFGREALLSWVAGKGRVSQTSRSSR
jgi:excisionase family DNA binding protein